MKVEDTIWYNTGDLFNVPRRAKILRIKSIGPAEVEHICKDILGGYRLVLKVDAMYEELDKAKDAKIEKIDATVRLLNDNATSIRWYTGDLSSE